METLTHCPVCNNTSFHSFLQVKDNVVSHETFSIDACSKCGFKFTNPRPNEKDIGKYYASENYIYHSNKKVGIFLRAFHFVREIAIKRKIRFINSLVENKADKTILDYGCGTGEFLSACKKNGWKTVGIETSPEARNYGIKNFGLEISDLPEFYHMRENSFDVITLWHVLEHVHKLKETLQTLSKLIRKDGRILIAVPNCSSRDAKTYGRTWAAYDAPRHLYHFIPQDIEKLVSANGMKLEKLKPMPFDAFYVSLLSEKFRNGKINYVSGIFQGLLSNLSKGKDSSKCSSITYVIKKA